MFFRCVCDNLFQIIDDDMTQLNSQITLETPDGGSFDIGNDQTLTILAGPCAMESRDHALMTACLLYTSPSPRDATLSRMPSSA